jgi:conjugative relaxase-like TrwC/TraI family protein
MLRIAKLSDAEYLIGQVALGIDDYYLGAGEAPGVWHGDLAADLGLSGVVDADQLRALVLGDHPTTGEALLGGHRARKVAAFDVTFSAPKSVSVLWAFASPEVASAASIAHVEAVTVAVDFLERRATNTRQQVDGKRELIPTGVAAATFVHRTSREGDPQIHTHAVVLNLGVRPDGTYAALDATSLYDWGKAAGSIYQEELRRRLTERLGVEWGPDRHGCREMVGFDPAWLRAFSKRTVAIEEHLAGAGPENPTRKQRMRADEAASLATRPRKDGSLTPELLRDRWQAETDQVGLPTGHGLEAQICNRVIPEFRPRLEWAETVARLVDAEEGLCAHRARFNEAQVLERVAALGAGRLDVGAVEDLAWAFLNSDDAVFLLDRNERRLPLFSTRDHLLLEGRVLDHLDQLAATPVAGLDPAVVEGAIAGEAPGLGDDQAAAVRALCEAGPVLRSLIAPAGFGKTIAIHAAAVAATASGHPVVGLAATNQAAGELRQAGVPAMTIARFALDGATLPAGAVVILDEISQVATADAEIVLAAVTGTPGALLWCLGDPHQAQSVRAGGIGTELTRLGDQGHIPSPQLTTNRRQLESAEREALAHYRTGRIALSQAIRTRHGWEHDLGSPHQTREALADAVVADLAAHGPAGTIALAVAHADCEDLADRIRDRLRATGHIHGPEMSGPAWHHGQRHYAAGDRILVHGTLRTGERRLHNGTVLTVTQVAEDALVAADQPGRQLKLSAEFVSGHRGDGSPNISHAWARTIDGIQGGTWAQVHLLGTAALERYTGYTGQSRSQHATHTWNVTRLPEIDHGGILADDRSPDREVLDALLRIPTTRFAIHDDPSHIQRLLAERKEHETVLAGAPPNRRRELGDGERELRVARNEEMQARDRLRHAQNRFHQIRPLSLLRRHGRDEKHAALADIPRFARDVARAAERVLDAGRRLEQITDAVADADAWHNEHDWRQERLSAIQRELKEAGHIDLRHIDLDLHGAPNRRDRSRLSGLQARIERIHSGGGRDHGLPSRLDRHPEIASPPLPGHGDGLGMDLCF